MPVGARYVSNKEIDNYSDFLTPKMHEQIDVPGLVFHTCLEQMSLG